MQAICKLTVIFPCDFEICKNNEYSKNYVSKICVANEYRYSSPIFSINTNIPNDCTTNKNKLAVANDILYSCNLLTDCNRNISFKNKFELRNIFYPYGVSVYGEFSAEDLKNFLFCLEKQFTPFKREKANGKREETTKWIIYDKPIIIIEFKDYSDIVEISKEFLLEDVKNLNTIKTMASNNIIAIKNEKSESILESSWQSVLAVFIAHKKLSFDVRMKSKRLGNFYEASNREKKEIVLEIHQDYAIFEEITCKDIFYEKFEQVLFESLQNYLCTAEQQKQIQAARDNADYLLNESINKKADKINLTVFITGYTGLILSFFAFVPIQLKNIVWVNQTLYFYDKIILCFALVFCVILLCRVIVFLYYNWENSKKNLLEFYELLKSNAISNRLSSAITIFIILLLIISIIVFVIFIFSGKFVFT